MATFSPPLLILVSNIFSPDKNFCAQLYHRYPNLHVYAYGPLPCVDSVVANACSEFITRYDLVGIYTLGLLWFVLFSRSIFCSINAFFHSYAALFLAMNFQRAFQLDQFCGLGQLQSLICQNVLELKLPIFSNLHISFCTRRNVRLVMVAQLRINLIFIQIPSVGKI